MVPGRLATRAIFFLFFFREVLKMALIIDDFPELDRPTNKNSFSFLNKVLSSDICLDKN